MNDWPLAAFDEVLDAYVRFGDGDATKLIALLDTDVEWWADGSVFEIGRERVATHFLAAAGKRVELIGARKVADSVVLEFTRPWWKPGAVGATVVRSLFGIRGEQALRLDHGLVSRIESRELFAHTAE